MSCISVTLGLPKAAVVSVINPLSGKVETAANPTGWCRFAVKHHNAKITTTKIGSMALDIALVCSVGAGNYLLVRPRETMWITVDKSLHYDVRSNTDWIIN